MRAVAFQNPSAPAYAVVVDIPLGADIEKQLKDATGIELGRVTGIGGVGQNFEPVVVPESRPLDRPREWVAFLDYTDWLTGQPGTATMAIRTSIANIYDPVRGTGRADSHFQLWPGSPDPPGRHRHAVPR